MNDEAIELEGFSDDELFGETEQPQINIDNDELFEDEQAETTEKKDDDKSPLSKLSKLLDIEDIDDLFD